MGQEPVTAPSITAPTTSTQPSITTISPNQGAANTNVIIQGTNLSTASQVEFYDSTGPKGSLTPTSVSSSQVSFTIDGIFAANMSPGTYGVSVVTSTCKAGCNSNRLSFTITAPTVPPPTTTTSKPLVCGQKGDVNADGVISEADRERIRAFALGTAAPTEEERAAADVNGNDSVTTLDVSIITNYLLGNVQTFAGCVFVPKAVPASCGTLGDVSGDDKIDNRDIELVRKHVLGTTEAGTRVSAADVNGRDGVTMLDIAFLRRYLLGLDSTFPACSTATAQPSIPAPGSANIFHSADYNKDWKIDNTEFNRVQAYWRAGGYHIDPVGSDGFAAGYEGDHSGAFHSADYNKDWKIDNTEFNRVQAYWRAGGYHRDPAGFDGFAANDSIQPSITVLSPNGGETLTEGSQVSIRWSTNGLSSEQKMDISLMVGTIGVGQPIAVDVPNTGSYVWSVKSLQPFFASEGGSWITPTL